LALWLAVVASYGAVWFGFALVVNVTRRSSAANAMILAAVWLGFVVVTPAVLNVVVKSVHPVPSRVALIGAMRTASNEASAKGAALLAKVYGDHPELAPAGKVEAGEFMSRTYAVQDEVDRQVAPLLARFDEQLDKQQLLVERYRFASPAIVAYSALTDIAGTGTGRYRDWQRQVGAFHQRWQDFFIPRAFRRQWLTAADYPAIPRFQYAEEPTNRTTGRVAAGLAALLIPAALLWLVALTRLKRLEVAG
jgi:ABC-2 type transport system permease protein